MIWIMSTSLGHTRKQFWQVVHSHRSRWLKMSVPVCRRRNPQLCRRAVQNVVFPGAHEQWLRTTPLELTEEVGQSPANLADRQLAKLLSDVTELDATLLVRAFTVYFHLANTAEQVHRVEDLNENAPASGNRFASTVAKLQEAGITTKDIVAVAKNADLLLRQLRVEFVHALFDARHPRWKIGITARRTWLRLSHHLVSESAPWLRNIVRSCRLIGLTVTGPAPYFLIQIQHLSNQGAQL